MSPEAVVVAWLQPLGVTVASRHPESLVDEWVRVHLIDERPDPRSMALHLREAYVQVDCYAGVDNDPVAADALSSEVVELLHAMPSGSHTGAVVTAVTSITRRRILDADLDPARERYVVRCAVTMHPPVGGS